MFLAKNIKTTYKEDNVLDDNHFGLGIDDIKSKNVIDLGYDFNSVYRNISEIDKPKTSDATKTVPEEAPKRDKPTTE